MRFAGSNEQIPYDQEVVVWELIDFIPWKVVVTIKRVDEWRCSHDYSYDQYKINYVLDDELIYPNGVGFWYDDRNTQFFKTKDDLIDYAKKVIEKKNEELTTQLNVGIKLLEDLETYRE